jgi:hypothetical protein
VTLGTPITTVARGTFRVLITEGEDVSSQHWHGDDLDPYRIRALDLEFAPKRWHAWVYADTAPIAHVGSLERQVSVGEDLVAVAGIGSVITSADHRRRGAASAGLDAMLAFMREHRHLEFGMLGCLPPLLRYYRRFGWRALDVDVRCEQPGGLIRWPLELMIIDLGTRRWPEGPVDLRGPPW